MGSMLRGALGFALKRVTCINPSYNCEECFACNNCLYYDFYEKKNNFHQFRFDINLASENFDFALYLFENACEKLPYILSALHKVLTEIGLTRQNYTFKKAEIFVNGIKVFENGEFGSVAIEPKVFKTGLAAKNVKIKLITPLRIKKQNRLLRDNLELQDILRSIYQREQELKTGNRVYTLPYTPQSDTTLKLLQYKQLRRKSSRQKQTLNIDGLIGEMAVTNIDKESYNLLKLGELIGAGKQTVMGLGKIEIEEIK